MLVAEKKTCQMVSVTVPEEMSSELNKRAREMNLSVSALCRMVIEEWMETGEILSLAE